MLRANAHVGILLIDLFSFGSGKIAPTAESGRPEIDCKPLELLVKERI